MSLSVRHETTTPSNITLNDDFVIFDGPGAQVAFLYDARTAPPGTLLYISNPSNGGVTVVPNGSQTIDGNPSLLVVQTSKAILISDGNNWFTVSTG
jgi:hypothetical protein